MRSKIILSGIKPSGTPHIGNYAGMLRPALELASQRNTQVFLFIADYHALNVVQNASLLKQRVYEVAATFLALGLDPARTVFYRQSDVPEIFEISYALSCICPKGYMNRAHAYKAAVAKRIAAGSDPDAGISMGLFNYPLLMAADILTFDTDLVPVGKDQKQHVEYARDLAIKFNKTFGETFKVPEISLRPDLLVLPGRDGRKMSKSYGNTIPLFASAEELRRAVFKIRTDSKACGAPKDASESLLYIYFKAFASEDDTADFARRLTQGIPYGEAKERLFEKLDSVLAEPRRNYLDLIADKEKIDSILQRGAAGARNKANQAHQRLRRAVGILR